MTEVTTPPRPRGRPRKVIDVEQLLDAVTRIFAQDGLEAVSIERAAQEMGVSRATLYRSVPTKEHLLSLLLMRLIDEVDALAAEATKCDGRTAAERLHALMRTQFGLSISMRDYLFVFFGSGWLTPEVYEEWRRWSRNYEAMWVRTVQAAADEGALHIKDPVIATRLLLGQIMWVSRWYRPGMRITADDLADEAIRLLGGER